MAGFIQTMWLLLLVTSFLIGSSLSCIECDPRGKNAIENFGVFINSRLNENIENFVTIKRYAKSAEREVMQYLEDQVVMLDDFAISEIASEYKKCVDLIEQTDFTDFQLLQTVGLHFQRLKVKVRNIVEESNSRRCPNKRGENSCGLMTQTYTHCDTCRKETMICAGGLPENQEYFDRCSCVCIENKCTDLKTGHSCSPCRDHEISISKTVNCGERNVVATEDEDLILDCGFEWHARLEQPHKTSFITLMSNIFPFSPYIPLESKNIEDPYLEMKGIQMSDAGMYMCSTTLKTEVPVSKLIYHVKVIPGSGRTTIKRKPRPTLPHVLDMATPGTPSITEMPTEKISLTLIIILGASIVTFLLIAAICIFICIYRCRKRKQSNDLKEDPAKKANTQAYSPV